MKKGLIFDIKEFAVHDGPGIRTTVFLKGCPLKCRWCHNPEGIDPQPQMIRTPTRERIAGEEYTPGELADLLNRQATLLTESEGGVTFSGGEPLLQADFVAETIDQLAGMHVLLDTSGYGSPKAFQQLVERADLLFFDIKSMAPVIFERYCGGDLDIVIKNLYLLDEMAVPFVIRVPLIPSVTDTLENMAAIAQRIGPMTGLQRVDLLPYHRLAGAKYAQTGQTYDPGFDENLEPQIFGSAFEDLAIPWRVI
jgi:pyruvate formate lyase activating enzyme